MLSSIQFTTNKKVIARDVDKTQGPFLCPICKCELNIRKGHIKIHHFAHKAPVTCKYGVGESEVHRKAKLNIFDSLVSRSDVTECEIEKNLGTVIPDVYAVIRGVPIAIEVQISSLTIDAIIRRTENYFQQNIAVIWLPLFTEKLNSEKYSPAAWERWLHATYLGRVYYWLEGLSIIPVHFNKYYTYVESSSWYNQSGEEQSAGGYDKISKRWKTPLVGNQVNLACDFKIAIRNSWSGGRMIIPKRRILIDKQKPWWKK